MAGYIGKSQGVTQVDGYNRTEADAEFLNQTEGDARYVNVTGDTMTGTYSFGGFISLQTSDDDGYPRINGNSSSAQLGLFRSSGGSEGGFFVGGDAGQFSVWSSDFVRRMNVDASGRVTMPYQPAFWARRTAGNLTGPLVIVFNDAQLNIGSHYNASNGRFTIPVAGVYEFHVSLLTDGTSTRCQAGIRVNGSERTILEQSGGNGFQQGCMNLMLNMVENDYVEVFLNSSSDAAYGFGYNSFSGRLVS